MTPSFTPLKDNLNKAYRLIKPRRSDLDVFKSNLLHLLELIDEKESEENVKIHLMDFLKNTFYHPGHLVSTKERADLVIHLEKDARSPVGVLFEVKKPTNHGEMISKNNFDAKAMYELILYFLRERINNKNNSLTNLVITNIYEWFVFDATDFERIFTQDSALQKAYKEWDAGQKVSTKTDLFYKEIVKPFLAALDKEITFVHFDIRDYLKFLKKSDDEKNATKLIHLYKFFTPVHLLKLPFINDSNSLDKGFFSELLHIIGLEEIKEGGRKIIRRLPEGHRHAGSLLENTLNILDVEGALRKVPGKILSGKTQEEQIFNLGLELCITWVNRILFLKLLEAQLVRYHNGDQKYRFLNIQTIRDYDELYKLFFQVLARQDHQRSSLVQQKYGHIPYLNSSLFEISPLEDETIKINGLDDNLDIDICSNSVLKKRASRKERNMMNTLHYFFEFLDAYDFASVSKEEIQEENKTIINAAVLGLVFEKMNGYKDGSIYTPGAVTMFLCRETIRKAVIKKFNDRYGWQCESLADIKNYLSDRRNQRDILEFNSLIDSIKIADPTVGSGHFLVSSLNELIAIKAELGILADQAGKRITSIEVSIANDELVVNYCDNGNFFEYTVSTTSSGTIHIAPEVQLIQQTLFNEKRKIIEGCLFGVDINPNSVKICQLRLWIELLKHAYYRPEENYMQLETLPNIDINIKHGNSLLNKYSLSEDLTEVFRKQKFGVRDYRLAVEAYKSTANKDAKADLQQFIKTIKEQFHETVSRRDPRRKRLSELRGQLALAQNNFDLFGQKRSQKVMESEIKKINLSIQKLENEISEIEDNAVYRNAFEWRFEFPEVLDERGNFEGFEAIIGNPPYIQLQKMGSDADALQRCNYKTFARTGDIYCLFYEQAVKLLKPGYFLGFITSNKWMRANYGEAMRDFFLKETNPNLLVDFGGYQVFESATVDTNLLIAEKGGYSGATQTCLLDKTLGSLEKMSDFIRRDGSLVKFSANENWVILSPIEQTIKTKVEDVGIPLKNWNANIYRGILTGFNEAFIIDDNKKNELIKEDPKSAEIIRPILRGRDIKRYKFEFADLYIITTFPSLKVNIEQYPAVKQHLVSFGYDRLKQTGELGARKKTNNKWFETQDSISYWDDFFKQKIIWGEISDRTKFAIELEGSFLTEATTFIMVGKHLLFLVAYLNSRFSEYFFSKIGTTTGVGTVRWKKFTIEQLKIPSIDEHRIAEYEALSTQIIERAKLNSDSCHLESQINFMIYSDFRLSKEEIEFVESR